MSLLKAGVERKQLPRHCLEVLNLDAFVNDPESETEQPALESHSAAFLEACGNFGSIRDVFSIGHASREERRHQI
jgi:hypothetical protein